MELMETICVGYVFNHLFQPVILDSALHSSDFTMLNKILWIYFEFFLNSSMPYLLEIEIKFYSENDFHF